MKYLKKKVKQISNKFIKLIMLISIVFSSLQTPIYVFADEISNKDAGTNITPEKGDMRLGETGEIIKSGTISVTAGAPNLDTEGNVQVTKTVTEESDGKYKIDFLIKGKDVQNITTTVKPIYFVIVFDRSGSMICDSSEGGYAETTTSSSRAHYTAADGTMIRCEGMFGGSKSETLTEDKWTSAVSGAKSFADQLMKKNDTYVSIVTFASTASNATDFRTKTDTLYTESNFGHPYGGTDLAGAITKAQNKLNTIDNENAQKYILVISDGEPESTQSARNAANAAKNAGTKIYSVGYGITANSTAENVLKYVSSSTTLEDGEAVYDSEKGYYQSASTSGISSALSTIFEKVNEPTKAATNATLTDGIGGQFKIVTKTDEEVSGYGVSYTNNDLPEITEDGATVSFYIQINKDAPSDWYDTNAGFTFEYTDATGETQIISCSQNPQVYWVQQKYDYIVNYYKDSISAGNLLATETRQAPVNTIINESNVEKNKYLSQAGNSYEYESLTPTSMKITNSEETQVINILYVKAYGSLKVNYVDTDGNDLLSSITTRKEKNTSYQTQAEEIYGYTLKEIKGNETGNYVAHETIEVTYVYTKNIGTTAKNEVVKSQINEIIGVNSTFNYVLSYKGIVKDYLGSTTVTLEDTLPYDVLNIEYPESCSYDELTRKLTCAKTVELNENNQTIEATFNIKVTYKNLTSLTNLNILNKVTSTLKFGETEINDESEVTDTVLSGKVTAEYVDESNNTLRDSEITTGLVDTEYETNEKEIYGYTLKEIKGNETGKYTKEDITVTYVYSKNDGTTETNKVTKTGPEKVESVNGKFEYTLTYEGKIKDYVGEAKLTLKDTLPYELDLELSTYDDRCTYENKVLTCKETYEIDEENQTINEEFKLSLVFKNINSEKVTNKVESKLEYGKTQEDETDEIETEVLKGTVVVTYKNKQGELLAESITTTELAGTKYETKELEFLGYTLTNIPENQNGEYIGNATIHVDYIYDKNIGTSEDELEKIGPDKITDINKPFEYNIKYTLEIFDYVGEAKITLTDHLPYEIDEEKSSLGDVCKYIDGKIICEYLKNITNVENSKISIEENLILYYKNIISNEVTNKIDAKVVYGEEVKINNDEFTTEIPYGSLKVRYITEDGKTLLQTIITTNLVGTEYNTEQKSFENYYLKEVIGETSGIYTETDKEVVYVYSLVPLPPQTGVEINIMQYINLLILAVYMVVAKKRYI